MSRLGYRRAGAGVTAPVLGDGSAAYTPGVSERRGATTTYQHGGIKKSDAQSGASQLVTATRVYDAFGNLDSSTGSFAGYFGYGGGFGYQSDPDSGLKLLGHRYYDSSTGRFLTRDPVKDGRNWYAYCAGAPIGRADPTGFGFRSWMKHLWDNAVDLVADVTAALFTGEQVTRAELPDKLNDIEYTTPIKKKDDPPGGAPMAAMAGSWLQQVVEALDPTPVGVAMEAGQALGEAIDPWVEQNNAGGWNHGGTGSYNQMLREIDEW